MTTASGPTRETTWPCSRAWTLPGSGRSRSRLETQADKLADIVARGGTSANVLSANWAGADVRRMLTTWQDEAK